MAEQIIVIWLLAGIPGAVVIGSWVHDTLLDRGAKGPAPKGVALGVIAWLVSPLTTLLFFMLFARLFGVHFENSSLGLLR